MLERELAGCNLLRKSTLELLAEQPVEFDRMHDGATIKQGTGQDTLTRPDLKHLPSIDFGKVRNAVYRVYVNEKVLVVVRFHFVVKR
jgi:hypothetical protein